MTTYKKQFLTATQNVQAAITLNTEFVYLGHKLAANNNEIIVVQRRIVLFWEDFNRNKEVLTAKRVSHHLKSTIFETSILLFVLHGFDCVNWAKKALQNLATFQ